MTNKRLLIDATHAEEIRVIIADENRIHELDISATSKTQNKGNIYLAKVTRVEPSLQAAFVEYGGDRQGFLPFSEIHPDYYQIPVADRKKLIEEAAAEQEAEEEDDEQETVSRKERGDRNDRGNRGRRGRRRGGRNPRRSGEQDEQREAGEPEVSEEKSTQNEEGLANTYQQEPIAAEPSVKSDVVEDLLDQPEEAANSTDFEQQEKSEGDIEEIAENGEEKTEVESLGDDDEFTRRRKASFLRRYKIQEVIKRNQVILVQVIKEERGNKGASLSTYISLAGRYCVLMPNSPKTGGISRKISSSEDRKRLKEISEEIRSTNGMSAIIRTAGIDRTRAEIKRDYDYLLKLWNQIRELTISSTAPALVYEEADIVKRSLRDLYSNDIKEVVVAGEDAYKRSREFMKLMMPSHTARIKLHTENTPIFYAYDAEDQLLRMHEPQVKLESGGSIVINPTEALVSIDVNSGRSTTERNVEETALKTNLEAAQEIARQVRLRDLAGLIVIDFIDMFDYKNRRSVERQLKEALKSDRAKIQLGRISAFGLLEMSRQRLRPSLAETNTHSCAYCEGRGFILTPDAQGIQLLRYLEKEATSQDYSHLKLKVQPAIAMYLLNTKRERLIELEKTHQLKISIEVGENLLSAASFILERYTIDGQKTEVNGMDGIPTSGKRNRSRKRKRDRLPNERYGKSSYDNETEPQDGEENSHESESYIEHATEKTEEKTDEAYDRSNRRRRRGGRRRGGRNRDEYMNQTEPSSAQQESNATPIEAVAEKKAEPQETPVIAEAAVAEKRQPRAKAEKAEKPVRKRPGRPKKVAAEDQPKDETVAAVAAEKPASQQEVRPAPAVKPSPAPQEKKELETVGVSKSANDDEKKDSRKGWWRRIVE